LGKGFHLNLGGHSTWQRHGAAVDLRGSEKKCHGLGDDDAIAFSLMMMMMMMMMNSCFHQSG